MAKSLRRRAILGAFSCLMLAPTVGCQATRLTAAKFAEGFISAKVDMERLIGETCAAFSPEQGAPTTSVLQRDLLRAKQHDLDVLARALCTDRGCALDTTNLTIRMEASAKPNALLRVIAREINKQAQSPEDLEKAAARVVADGQAMAQVLLKMNLARAGVFVALKLGDSAQNLSDKLADSFGIAQGFARPVLEVVTSEIVAATMDQTFSLIEGSFHVPRANFTEQACAIYRRSEPRSNVAAFVLERAILRYAPPEKLDALVANGIAIDCEHLNEWMPSAPLDGAICERIRLAVETNPSASIKSTAPQGSSDPALHMLVKPSPPLPDVADVPVFVEKEAEALRKSADACAEAYPRDREGACTLERIIPVASDAYAKAVANQSGVSMEQLHFDDMEQRLAAIENELVRTTDRLLSDEQRLHQHEMEQKSLRDLVEAQQQRMAALEKQLFEQRTLVTTILAQDEALRKVSGQMSDLAVAAYRDKCKKQHDDALAARLQFAKNLGFPANICTAPHTLERVLAPGMQVQPAMFCRPDLPMAIDFAFRFDTQVTVGHEKKCDSEVHCNDPHNKPLCEALQRIATELTPADFPVPPEGSRRPYRFVGHASLLGVLACEAAGRAGAQEMAQRGVTALGSDSYQNGISYLRAKTTAEEFGKMVASKTAGFEMGRHVDLVAAGTTHVTGIGNPAKPRDQEAFQREFQRVAMEIHAPRFVFTVNDCLNLH